jgi:hypothetical protein
MGNELVIATIHIISCVPLLFIGVCHLKSLQIGCSWHLRTSASACAS